MSRNKRNYSAATGCLASPDAVNRMRPRSGGDIDFTLRYSVYATQLLEIAMSRFKWTGLPDTVSERYLEMRLHQDRMVLFFNHDSYGFIVQPAAQIGQTNLYDDPVAYRTTGTPLPPMQLTISQCVPIWSNRMRTVELAALQLFAQRLAELDVSVDNTVRNSRHPVIIGVDESNKLSMINAYRQLAEGEPFIVAFNQLAAGGEPVANAMSAIDLGVKVTDIDTLQLAKSRIWNDAMTWLGVDNSNQDKKERLVESEVDGNASQIVMARHRWMDTRLEAVEHINARYGLNIGVEWNEDPSDLPLTDDPTDNDKGIDHDN